MIPNYTRRTALAVCSASYSLRSQLLERTQLIPFRPFPMWASTRPLTAPHGTPGAYDAFSWESL